MYMYLPIIALIIGIGFVFFSDDVFRYECQDPAFWGTPECEPPVCKAAGICTEDLIKIETSTIEEIITEEVITETTDSTIDTPQDIQAQDIQDIVNEIQDPTCNCNEDTTNGQ